MKKGLTIIMSFVMLFSMTLSGFAADNKTKVVKQPAKTTIQKKNVPAKENKKISDVINDVNQSVVAVIGKNAKMRQEEYIYSKFPINLQHGSGVIISKDGRVLTNNHVIDGLDEIYVVTYDGKVYKATLLYTDKEIDLALLKINRTNLKPMNLSKEKDTKVGDEVIAIGTPLFFGYRNSASKGIISGLNRPVDRAYTYLQTDASINPGNSGGPLVNMKSELVGINTLGYTFYQGVNFSIPIGNINYFLDHYKKFGRIKRCYIGIEYEENWAAMLGIPTDQGLKVVAIQKGATVTSEQVKEGDMLIGINGKPITSIAQYNEILKAYLPGNKVTLTFMREDSKFDIKVDLMEQPFEEKK